MTNVVQIHAFARSHADLLQSLLLVIRDGVRRKRLHPDVANPLMAKAAKSDCAIIRIMLETVMKEAR
jgi:hypothetical protein